MKLNQEQLDYINRFLTRMELAQIDLRNEVLDHMASSVEVYMEKGFSFKEALDLVSKDWYPELRSHQSFWLGLLWTGPKILIEKAVDRTKIIYLKAALVATSITVMCYVLLDFLSIGIIKIMNDVIGWVYILLFMILVYLNLKIKRTSYKTSFSFLFKIHAIGFSFLLVLYNPLFSNIFGLIHEGTVSFTAIAMHTFTMAFCGFFFSFYKSHMNIGKFDVL